MTQSVRPGRWTTSLLALTSYVAAALVFNWPLPARMASAFTGPVTGDTGIYVWNLWVFRHEIVAHGRFPLFTSEIMSLAPRVDLSLHNYTIFSNILAFPLIPILGVPATFNVIYLGLAAFTAWTMFLLARRIVGRTAEAWIAGLLFGFSPVLVARSTAHFSLVAAAPLPVFVLCLIRAEEHWTRKNAAALGATVAWASMCDVYFGVYCVLIGAVYLAARQVQVELRRDGAARHQRAIQVVDFLILTALGVVIATITSGGARFRLVGLDVRLDTLYNPMFALTLLASARLVLTLRPKVHVTLPAERPSVQSLAAATAACVLLMSPQLYALGWRLADGGTFHHRIFWRSSPRGVDLLALFTPNPNHKLFGTPWREWLTTRDGGYVENVAALTLVGVVVVGVAVWRSGFRPPRVWVALTVAFGALALGPFVYVGGVNTFVPGPWALLRYVPFVSAARTPARFAIVLMMAFSIVFALALAHLADRRPARRRLLLLVIGLALAFELAPLPRQAMAAPIPEIYRVIAEDPRDVRVLEIPLGFMDGERTIGSGASEKQFYQTVHQKPIIGGAMSRINDRELVRQRRIVILRVLLQMSEGLPVEPGDLVLAQQTAGAFTRYARLGYVVINASRTSPELRRFVTESFGLERIGESQGRELYRPTVGVAPPPSP